MKCPRCGAWNRASLPRCFQCGAPLPEENGAAKQNWKAEMGTGRQEKIYFDVDEEGNIDQTPDSGDTLAQEMESLRERRLRGYEEQRRLREAETHPYARLTNRTGRRRQNTTRRSLCYRDSGILSRVHYARYILNEAERTREYAALEQKIVQEDAAWIPLFSGTCVYVTSSRVVHFETAWNGWCQPVLRKIAIRAE